MNKKQMWACVNTQNLGDDYDMPHAPPFGAKEETVLVNRMKKIRKKVLSILPYSTGQKIVVGVSEGDIERIEQRSDFEKWAFPPQKLGDTFAIKATIKAIIIRSRDKVIYECLYKYKTTKDQIKTVTISCTVSDIHTKTKRKAKDERYCAKIFAEYENERHNLSVRYSFVTHKTASELRGQCRRGTSWNDLCQSGFDGIINTIDRWPPFLGAKDKGPRLLTSIRVAVHNAICRFLDDHNRTIGVPSYMTDQLTVRKIDDILNGKKKKDGQRIVGPFESSVENLVKDLNLEPEDIDGKTLRDIAIETGNYRKVAEILGLSVGSFINIIEPMASIHTPLNNDNEDSMADMIPHEKYDSDRQSFLRETIEEALDMLTKDNRKQGLEKPERDAEILRDHYFCNLSIRELQKKYKISTMRASELIKKSAERLQRSEAAMNILIHKIVGR